MVRSDTYRKKKYEAKVTGDIVKARFDALKEVMQEQVNDQFTNLVQLETQVGAILDNHGVPPNLRPAYINVAREVYRLARKFSGQTLKNEACIVRDKWIARGLDATIVDEILELFGITCAY